MCNLRPRRLASPLPPLPDAQRGGRRGLRHAPVGVGQRAGPVVRHHALSEVPRFVEVRAAREDEGPDAYPPVGLDLRQDLVGRAHERRSPSARGRCRSTGAARRSRTGRRAHTGPMRDAEGGGVLRPLADQPAVLVVEPGHEVLRVLPSLGPGVADDDVDAKPVVERPAMGRGPLGHVAHPLGDALLGLGPHEVHVAGLRAEVERFGRAAAEVEERPVLLVGPGRSERPRSRRPCPRSRSGLASRLGAGSRPPRTSGGGKRRCPPSRPGSRTRSR